MGKNPANGGRSDDEVDDDDYGDDNNNNTLIPLWKLRYLRESN